MPCRLRSARHQATGPRRDGRKQNKNRPPTRSHMRRQTRKRASRARDAILFGGKQKPLRQARSCLAFCFPSQKKNQQKTEVGFFCLPWFLFWCGSVALKRSLVAVKLLPASAFSCPTSSGLQGLARCRVLVRRCVPDAAGSGGGGGSAAIARRTRLPRERWPASKASGAVVCPRVAEHLCGSGVWQLPGRGEGLAASLGCGRWGLCGEPPETLRFPARG